MKFKIGQKVVAVGFEPAHTQMARQWGLNLPVNGNVYTIRDRAYLPDDVGGSGHNGNGYRLEEVVNPPNIFCYTLGKVDEVFFDEEFFRPLIDASKEVEALKRLCNPKHWTDEDRKRMTPVAPRQKEKA